MQRVRVTAGLFMERVRAHLSITARSFVLQSPYVTVESYLCKGLGLGLQRGCLCKGLGLALWHDPSCHNPHMFTVGSSLCQGLGLGLQRDPLCYNAICSQTRALYAKG